MHQTDPRVDAYIAKAAPFAQPILERLRKAVHAANPAGEEAIKWSMPFFMHNGRILANMAAFKSHCAFGFGHGDQVVMTGKDGEAMGQFGRIESLKDLPSQREITALAKKSMALIDQGVKAPRAPKSGPPRAAPETPADLAAALAANAAAGKTYVTFPPSCRREYVEWIEEAKRPETRAKRLAQTVQWLAEGKRRNWKYENC